MPTLNVAALRIVLVCLSFAIASPTARAQKSYRPDDPIASIEGDPVLLGELNYLLMAKLKVADLSAVSMQVQQASSGMLVKRHLAMRTLRQQGGQALTDLLNRQWAGFESQLTQQGVDVDDYAKRFRSVTPAIRNGVNWETAWRGYLKSRMTEQNLKLFYGRNPDQYAATRWNVSHLFIPIDDDDASAAELAQQRIQRIAADLKKEPPQSLGQKFAELAKRESDGATAADGGMIGWVTGSGDLPPTVFKAVQATEVGDVSEVTESPMGMHLVMVHDKESKATPFEALEDIAGLRRDAANAMFDALVAKQSGAKVIWYIGALKPPKDSPQAIPNP